MILEFLLTILVLSPLLFVREQKKIKRNYTADDLKKIESQIRAIENINTKKELTK